MSSSALPQNAALLRTTLKVDSTASSTSTSTAVSPSDSPAETPRQSPSSTSLSSLSSLEEPVAKDGRGRLVDTYGNDFSIPDYTIKQIRDAIPLHCFERSGRQGLQYVARDLACLATVFYIFYHYVTAEAVPSKAVRFCLWVVYTFVQGLFGTGLWVLAHEAGHQSFSPSKKLNDTVGFLLHSALLVPYFSWKISHGKHHKSTGHIERDMVFVPATREEYASKWGKAAHEIAELVEEAPLYTVWHLLYQQLGGWLAYLLSNVTGHDFHERQPEGKGKGKKNGFFSGINHFLPSSPLYEKKDEHLILLSDLGLAIVGMVLFILGQKFGWSNMLVWYFAPYLWVNHWLVAITFLQHTDPSLPHYTGHTWTFARGAAATIDRDMGFIGRHLFHGIIETHVLHHYVSTIPFYHADEASEAIKPIMGNHYRSDTAGGPWGFLKALWTSARWCHWVEPSDDAEGEGKGVLFFRNRNGLGIPPTSKEVYLSQEAGKKTVLDYDSDAEN
ncbi:delta(12) fatty acid desaturase [Viridothelium virens]|uniref:Delta(12) fatty acid desaturase n=1 Tax=Viridothelium virens TaxID=1048519 RepID=A0A6A6GY86_VIRVR|nr:delta(12) fatty acid desaturase [Viridothelium virens]